VCHGGCWPREEGLSGIVASESSKSTVHFGQDRAGWRYMFVLSGWFDSRHCSCDMNSEVVSRRIARAVAVSACMNTKLDAGHMGASHHLAIYYRRERITD